MSMTSEGIQVRSASAAEPDAAELVRLHEPFVYSRAHAWVRAMPWLDVEDLAQEGRIALWKATRLFKESHGVKFLTYAGRWVDHCIRRYVQKHGNVVRVPRHLVTMGPRLLHLDMPMGDEAGAAEVHAVFELPAAEPERVNAEDVEVVRTALARLPRRERQAVHEYIMLARPGRTVAVEMRCCHTRVQQLAAAGLARLRRAMRHELR